MNSAGTFLLMWLGFFLLMLAGVGAVLVWAVRARQFTDQDRARYLPLDREGEGGGDGRSRSGTGRENGPG